jgi:indole-3-acetate monooxygenase
MTETVERHDRLATDMMARVESVQEIVRASAAASEENGWLAPEAVRALRDAGLLRMNVAEWAGGLGVPPAIQVRVLARLAELDSAAAWNTMVTNNSAAFMADYLPERGYQEVFADGVPVCAGVIAPYGGGVPVEGGLRVTGRFRLCSGVRQASWVRLATMVGDQPQPVFLVVPQAEFTIHDNWDAVGLRGSGSPDVSLHDTFVPAYRAFSEQVPLRGDGRRWLTGLVGAAYEHVGIAVGLGRRGLAEAATLAATRPLVRESALTRLGRLMVRLDAVEGYAVQRFDADYRLLGDPGTDMDTVGRDHPALATLATDLAVECVEFAYRFAGAAAVYRPNVFEQLLRDIHAASQHMAVREGNYTDLAAAFLARLAR